MGKGLDLGGGRGRRAKRQRSVESVGAMGTRFVFFLEVRLWDRREAGEPREVWGHAEQRLGFGGGPSAPDLWGWKQWLGRCCLARCRGTSLFSFPAPIFPSSPRSLPLQQAHPVHWPLDSTFLHADLFAAASACSHSEVGNKAGTGAMWKGAQVGLPRALSLPSGTRRHRGRRGMAPQTNTSILSQP